MVKQHFYNKIIGHVKKLVKRRKSPDKISFFSHELLRVPLSSLDRELDFSRRYLGPDTPENVPYEDFKMEVQDAPILRYIFRNFKPKRHLEFGTWMGNGVVLCLEECDASVWTLNLPFGENDPSTETPSYNYYSHEEESLKQWVHKLGIEGDIRITRTDSVGFVGYKYLERGMGSRVCQIYCQSKDWDISQYPPGFFDSVLIDGGHTREIVMNDTQKALQLLRSGGIIIWHDFCPMPEVDQRCASPKGVHEAIYTMFPALKEKLSTLFWIDPSWLLVGLKK